MMDHNKVKILLNDYVDDILPHDLIEAVESHILDCKECNNFHLSLRSLLEKASSIPNSIEPPKDLWKPIYEEIRDMEIKNKNLVDEEGKVQSFGDLKGASPKTKEEPKEKQEKVKIKRSKSGFLPKTILGLIIILIAAALYFFIFSNHNRWNVLQVSGSPEISGKTLTSNETLSKSEVLQTDINSRALIKIPNIGSLHVGPNSVIRRLGDFSFSLGQGNIRASEDSASEFLEINIPSAEVKDFNLGNSYTLTVNSDGNGSINVEKGWVRISNINRESIIPGKYYCDVKKGVGPGIPYSNSAPQELISALNKFSFRGDMETIPVILSLSKQEDAVSLWHLLQRVDPKDRGKVFDKLSEFIKPPKDANTEEILKLNRKILIDWLDKIDLTL